MSKYGRDDLMAIAAVRYCLGRQTYIVFDCADWLLSEWKNIEQHAQNIIKRDIEEAFTKDDEARKDGCTYKPLGMDMDRAEWERVRKLWTA